MAGCKYEWLNTAPPPPTNKCVLYVSMFHCSDSPHEEARDDGDPGDTAGLRPFGVLIYVFAAEAEAEQVNHQDQQAQTQANGADTRQKQQRLRPKRGKGQKQTHNMNLPIA